MTTKQVPSSPSHAALPPGPGKAQTPKRPPGTKDFASVIDQAANNPGKPAHVRTTKSATRGRRDDSAETHVRERSFTPAREAQLRARPTRTGESALDNAATDHCASSTSETQADAPSEQVHGKSDSPATLVREKTGKNPKTTAESETLTGDTTAESVETGADATETETPVQTTAPANIIPFPGTANAVIIPFPLTEAQAVRAVAKTALPTTENAVSAAVTEAVSNSAPTAQAGKAGAPQPPETDNPQAAINISSLGLRPVSDGATVSLEPVASEAASTKPAAEVEGEGDSPTANVVSVAFNAAQASKLQAGTSVPGVAAQTQLPGDEKEAEETARQPLDTPVSASSAKIVLLRTDAGKPAPVAAASDVAPSPATATEPAGISSARQEDRMESMTASKHAAAAANTAGAEPANEAPAEFTTGNRAGLSEVSDMSDRTKVATDWQSGRSVSSTDRPVLETSGGEPSTASVSVERISSLVLREAALVKKYSSDSMAVVLRPDAETELFVHLTQRNGQVEATVRCERGDAQHLNALWPQLQESLAQHKVRLAPLEDSAGARGNTNFQPPSGSLMNGGGERGPREDARPSQQQSMDEWPATPAPAAATPHVRGDRGTRGRRISTSRPGWETWA